MKQSDIVRPQMSQGASVSVAKYMSPHLRGQNYDDRTAKGKVQTTWGLSNKRI